MLTKPAMNAESVAMLRTYSACSSCTIDGKYSDVSLGRRLLHRGVLIEIMLGSVP